MSDVKPLTEQEIDEIHDEPMLLHTWDAFRIIATLDALRAELAQVKEEREQLRARADVACSCCENLASRFAPGATFIDLPDLINAQMDRMTREAMAARKMMNSVTSGELSGYALDYFNEQNYDAWCAIRAENEKEEAKRGSTS